MNRQEKIEYIKSQIEEFTDSAGDVDGIEMIVWVQAKFGLTGKEAESLVDDALGYGD